jgi:NTE family protein
MVWNWRRMGRDLLTRHTLAESILDPEPFWSRLTDYFGSRIFTQTRLPLYVAATSLTHRMSVVFGPNVPDAFFRLPHVLWIDASGQQIFPAVRASSSIPGFFPPEHLAGMLLVDGGLTDDFPLDIAEAAGADRAFGLWIDEPARWQVPSPRLHLVQVLAESMAVTIHHMSVLKKNTVSIPYVILRLEMDHHVDMARIPSIIRAGYTKTMSQRQDLLRDYQ